MCHGRGFTPTKDLATWLEAAWSQLSWSVEFVPTLWVGVHRVTCRITDKRGAAAGVYKAWETWDTVEQAFYAALKEAVTPLAINADEARDWVEANILAVV